MRYAVNTPDRFTQDQYPASSIMDEALPAGRFVRCSWTALRDQLLRQWNRLTPRELDNAGPDRVKLASLICAKYDISSILVENYLRNFERTMPVM
jgi:hypothetical protein